MAPDLFPEVYGQVHYIKPNTSAPLQAFNF